MVCMDRVRSSDANPEIPVVHSALCSMQLQQCFDLFMLGGGDCENDNEGNNSGDKNNNISSVLLVSLQLWTSENQGEEGETGDADN